MRTGSTDSEAAVEGTGLSLSKCYVVSVVTPEEPAVDPFSGEVLNEFPESFGALVSPLRPGDSAESNGRWADQPT